MTMIISFRPQLRAGTLTLSKIGDVLTINGTVLDLSAIPEGATLPADAVDCEWIARAPIERIEGVLHLTLLLPHGDRPEPWQAFPEPLIVTDDGPIDVPVDTTVTATRRAVAGGTEIVTTIKRWRQEPEIKVEFVPDPEPQPNPEDQAR